MKLRIVSVFCLLLWLAVGTRVSAGSVVLMWTAPGGNGRVGQAARYEIRYSTAPITASNWTQATKVANPPAPLPAGNRQYFKVTGLQGGVLYYFGLKTADAVGNWSGISNTASHATCPGVCVVQGNVDGSLDGKVTAVDLALLVAFLTNPTTSVLSTVCLEQANADGSADHVVSSTDLAYIILYLQSGVALPRCQ